MDGIAFTQQVENKRFDIFEIDIYVYLYCYNILDYSWENPEYLSNLI